MERLTRIFGLLALFATLAIQSASAQYLFIGNLSYVPPGGPSPPAPAAAVGFTTLAMHSTLLSNTAGNWYQSVCMTNCVNGATQNGNGTILLNPASQSAMLIATAQKNNAAAAPYKFSGVAYGCGFYAQVVMSWTGNGTPPVDPTLWSADIETLSSGGGSWNSWGNGSLSATLTNGNANVALNFNPTNVFANGTGTVQVNDVIQFTNTVGNIVGGTNYHVISTTSTSAQISATTGGSAITPSASGADPLNFYEWHEFDIVEDDLGALKIGTPDATHAWFNVEGVSPTAQTHSTFAGQSVSATFKSQAQTYAGMWVPATAGTPGYFKWFLNGVLGGTQNYNLWSASNGPPPIYGTTAMAGVDNRHLVLMMGTAPANPVTIYDFQLWQGPGACNITEP